MDNAQFSRRAGHAFTGQTIRDMALADRYALADRIETAGKFSALSKKDQATILSAEADLKALQKNR